MKRIEAEHAAAAGVRIAQARGSAKSHGPFKFLFIDDRWIARTYGLHRRIGQARKHPANPLITADRPWEGGLKLYGTVLKDNGRYRMWYQMVNFRESDVRWATGVGYAESRDGLRWTKPLKGVEHSEHGPTNILASSAGRAHLCSPSVVKDRGEPARARRYKMMFYDAMSAEDLERHGSPFPMDASVPGWRAVEGEGMFVCTSADGIAWDRPAFPVFAGPNDVAAMSQLSDGRLLASFKTSERPDRHFRVIETAESADGRNWTRHGVVLEPDWRDRPGTEFYGMSAFEYFGNLIGLVCVYHNSADDKSLDVQLATATSASHWQRAADRGTLIARGERGEWDAGGIYIASSPLLVSGPKGDELRLYYSGISARHDDMRYKEWSIGLATLRPDGFASLEAGYHPAELVTPPITVPGGKLCINAQARHGIVMASMLDAETGETLALSQPMREVDATRIGVRWQRRKAIGTRPVILVFGMRKAQLYSFWFE